MGSPARNTRISKYVGDGSATARKFHFGYRPNLVRVLSVEGEAVLTEAKSFSIVAPALPAPIAADQFAFVDDLGAAVGTHKDTLGLVLTTTLDTLNKVGVEYLLIAE